MKIACIGNMNNNMFCLTRYLRAQGLDCDLLLLWYEQDHFHPSCDSLDDGWKTYTHRLTKWGSKFLTGTLAETYAEDLAPYDKIIGSNLAPAFVYKAGRTLDIFCPHGSDYTEVPYIKDSSGNLTDLAKYQRKGISAAKHCFAARTNQKRYRLLTRFIDESKIISLPITQFYLNEYKESKLESAVRSSTDCATLKKIKANADFLIFHHSRQCWTGKIPLDAKDNQIFFQGVAQLYHEQGIKPAVAAFEYGPDVDASKALVEKLEIDHLVHWFPILPRKKLMPMLWLSDLVGVQFADSWLTGSVLFESMALSKPILTRRDDEQYSDSEEWLPPILNASTPEGVSQQLSLFADNRETYKKYGVIGKQWLDETRTQPTIQAMLEILLNKQAKVK